MQLLQGIYLAYPGGCMKFFKLFIAVALFTTSVTFEDQIIVSKAGIDSTWSVTFNTPVANAMMNESAAY